MRRQLHHRILSALFCAVVTALVFSRGLDASFLFDDDKDVVQRHALREGVVAGAMSSPYRAVTYATYAFDMERGEGDPRAFHQTNLVIHVLFVFILCLFTISFLESYGFANPIAGAIFGCLIFGLHPIMVSNATYISGRAGMLAALFSLCSLWLFMGKPFKFWVVPAIIAFMLALFSKEDAAALPVAITLIAYTREKSRQWIVASAAFFVVAIVFTLLRLFTHRVDLGVEGVGLANLLLTPYAWMRGLATFLIPIRMSIDHLIPPITGLDIRLIYFIPVIFLIVIGYLRWRSRSSDSIPLIWFFVSLLPTGLIPLADVYMENRFYFAYAGLAVGAAMFAAKLLDGNRKIVYMVAFSLILLPLAVLTNLRHSIWYDQLALWTDTARQYPTDTRALDNIALIRFNENDLHGATFAVKKAIAIAPNDAIAWNTLGLVQKEMKHYDEAIAAYDKAIAASPGMPKVRTNRAAVLLQLGKIEEAERGYIEAISVDPMDGDAHYGLGYLYYTTRMPEKAVIEMKKALEINPDDADARSILDELQRGY